MFFCKEFFVFIKQRIGLGIRLFYWYVAEHVRPFEQFFPDCEIIYQSEIFCRGQNPVHLVDTGLLTIPQGSAVILSGENAPPQIEQ